LCPFATARAPRAASRKGIAVRVSLFQRGSTWWVRYSRCGRKVRQSLKTENRKVAEDLRLTLEYKLRRGDVVTEEKRVPVDAFVAEYRTFSLAHKRPKSHATDMARVAEFTRSLKVRAISDVETGDVSSFLSKKVVSDSIAPTTVLRYREALHALFEHAKRLGYVRENPVSAVPRPRVPERDPRFLSLDQIEELLQRLDAHPLQPIAAALIYAGLRRSELCWLTWSDLDLASDPPVLRVRAKTVNGEAWLPKTKRNRTVPVSPKLLPFLKRLDRNGTPWVFPSPEGKRWDPDNLSSRFRDFLKRMGLPWNFLDFRHTFGSQLAKKGVSLLKIAVLMGNSPEIARRHYIHLIPEELHADVVF
jgi:integrase